MAATAEDEVGHLANKMLLMHQKQLAEVESRLSSKEEEVCSFMKTLVVLSAGTW